MAIDETMMHEFMSRLVDEDRESVEAMLGTMDDADRTYMFGYVNGFADAVRMANGLDGGMPGFHIGSDSDKMMP